MNLLIVDDENLIVEDLRTTIDWPSFGIKSVFTAGSMLQARQVFIEQMISIMLCDIEMPQGSGIELLSWVRANYPGVQAIIMTSHADFHYAKEAIRLGSLDYLLKPILPAELQASIKKAIDYLSKDSQLEMLDRYQNFSYKNQPIIIERFWLDIISQAIPASIKAIRQAADSRDIPFSDQIQILPILISVQKWQETLSLQDEKIMEFGLKNIAEEILFGGKFSGQFLTLGRGQLLGVIPAGSIEEHDKNELAASCRLVIEKGNQYLACILSCYIGDAVQAHQLSAMTDKLLLMKKNNVAFTNQVFTAANKQDAFGNVLAKDMSAWSVMILEGARKELLREVEKYLIGLSLSGGLDASRLFRFQIWFSRMLHSALEQRGIRIRELINDPAYIERQMDAPLSIEKMIDWLRYVVDQTMDYADELEDPAALTSKVINYIKDNVELNLSREEIALKYFRNSDYLDRIFKRQTGISVSKYLVQEKMKLACELLSSTDISISTIASRVGYSNMSNFSSAFKKYAGLNPAEFRKKQCLNANKSSSKS